MIVFLLQIYPDPESEKAIMGSVVYCIHHKEGCQWSDELRKLKVSLIFFFLIPTRTRTHIVIKLLSKIIEDPNNIGVFLS